MKEFEAAGIVERQASDSDPSLFEYQLTDSGRELGPLVEAFGIWGQRWMEANLSLQHLDVSLLMWDMRRNLDTTPMPKQRRVVEFAIRICRRAAYCWLLVDPESGGGSLLGRPWI